MDMETNPLPDWELDFVEGQDEENEEEDEEEEEEEEKEEEEEVG